MNDTERVRRALHGLEAVGFGPYDGLTVLIQVFGDEIEGARINRSRAPRNVWGYLDEQRKKYERLYDIAADMLEELTE